jgi:hypothetical protein
MAGPGTRRGFIAPTRMRAAIPVLAVLACLLRAGAAEDGTDKQRNLFVDDVQIDSMKKVTRTLHVPARAEENPVLTPDLPWEGSIVLQPGTVIYDEDEHVFKMWYNSLATASKPDIQELLLYATSKDGIHWEKPQLNIVDFHGSKANNVFLNWCSWNHSVIKDNSDIDASKRYKLAYWNWKTAGKEGVWVAFSPDGIHWSVYENNPVIPMAASGDTFSVMEDPGTHEFWMYHKSAISSQPASVFGGASLRKVARVVSKDFVHWKDDEIVLEPDTLDQPDTEFYGLSPFPYGNQYLGFLWVLHTYSQQIDVQLVSSRDGLAWDRSVHRRVFLPLGFVRNGYNGRGFDSEMIMSIAPPTVKDGKLWMYYSGFNVKHNSTQSEEVLDDRYLGQIGLASLPTDGFISLDATSQGQVVMKPTLVRASQFHLVAITRAFSDASHSYSKDWSELYGNVANGEGEVRVELEGEDGKAIAGFSAEDCDSIKGAIADHTVTWGGKSDITSLRGRNVRIKFVLKNASIFSYSL